MKLISAYASARSRKSGRPYRNAMTDSKSTVLVPNMLTASTRSKTVGPSRARARASDIVISIAVVAAMYISTLRQQRSAAKHFATLQFGRGGRRKAVNLQHAPVHVDRDGARCQRDRIRKRGLRHQWKIARVDTDDGWLYRHAGAQDDTCDGEVCLHDFLEEPCPEARQTRPKVERINVDVEETGPYRQQQDKAAGYRPEVQQQRRIVSGPEQPGGNENGGGDDVTHWSFLHAAVRS